jgi:hypothetical protein
MSEDWDSKRVTVVAGVAAGVAVAAGIGYWVYGRFIHNPVVNGERVLEANAPGLLSVWRYHQWFGKCDKQAFRKG